MFNSIVSNVEISSLHVIFHINTLRSQTFLSGRMVAP
jgi:hypothetical protein